MRFATLNTKHRGFIDLIIQRTEKLPTTTCQNRPSSFLERPSKENGSVFNMFTTGSFGSNGFYYDISELIETNIDEMTTKSECVSFFNFNSEDELVQKCKDLFGNDFKIN